MDLVSNGQAIRKNLDYLDAARVGSADDRVRYNRLIERGTCFLAYISGDHLAFAPSRFIGYKNNTFDLHAANAQKNGRETNPALAQVLGAEPVADPALEAAYRVFCGFLGISPGATGTAGAQRRYWASPDVLERLKTKSAAAEARAITTSERFSAPQFDVGRIYSRDQIADLIGLPEAKRKGNWTTGYSWQGLGYFLFVNVGVPGRTGHNYANFWDGKRLVWYATGNARLDHRQIKELISGDFPVNIFWRGSERSGFTYAGPGTALSVAKTVPLQIVWSFLSDLQAELGETAAPRSRRGPPPVTGTSTVTRTSGETLVYLMEMVGPVKAAFPSLQEGERIVKIGISNDPTRRREDLCCGFPPGCTLTWRVATTRYFADGLDAFHAEGALLEQLRLQGACIGGEFAKVDDETFSLLKKGLKSEH